MKKIILILLFFTVLSLSLYSQNNNTNTDNTNSAVTDNKNDKKELSAEEKKKKADQNRADYIERTMKFGTHKERKQAITYIEDVQDEARKQQLIKMLLEMLENENESTMIIKSIHVLGNLEEKGAIPLVMKFLTHESEDVRIAAVYFLKDMKAESSKPELVKLLKEQDYEKDSNFTIGIIKTLGDFKAVEVKDFAIEKIKNNKTTHNNRMALILFLGYCGDISAEDFLLDLYADEGENTSVRMYSASALAKLKSKKASDAFVKFIQEYDTYSFNKKKKYYKLYMYTVSALVKLGDDRAYDRLIDSLRSDNSSVRLQAINLLKDLKDKRSVDILKYKAKYDPNVKVQKAAKEALKEMGIEMDEDDSQNEDTTDDDSNDDSDK